MRMLKIVRKAMHLSFPENENSKHHDAVLQFPAQRTLQVSLFPQQLENHKLLNLMGLIPKICLSILSKTTDSKHWWKRNAKSSVRRRQRRPQKRQRKWQNAKS